MEKSVILQLAYDSIDEVFQTKNIINKKELLKQHPLLNEIIPTKIIIYVNTEKRGSYTNNKKLIDNIIEGAKKVAFENDNPMKISEYKNCEIEITLETPEGVLTQKG
jgi:hypothetical protein